MSKRLTQEEVIARFKAIHGDKYDYSKVEYKGSKVKVCIICPTHGPFWQRPADHLRGYGCLRCACVNNGKKNRFSKNKMLRKGVIGVGTNDLDYTDYNLHQLWRGMLYRGYSQSEKAKNPTYKDVTVCEEWLYLSNFARWVSDPINGYRNGYQLDKDLIVKGNKVYSPDTCCFLPPEINYLFKKAMPHKAENPYPVGVHKYKKAYVVQLYKYRERVYIGSFSNPRDAFIAYKDAKESHIKELAQIYYERGDITKRVYDAMMQWEVEITD